MISTSKRCIGNMVKGETPIKYKKLFVNQLSSNDCGCASLATVCKYYHFDVSLNQIKHIAKPQKGKGTSIWELSRIAEEIGFSSKSVKLSPASLKEKFTLPAIIHMKLKNGMSHFAVILKISNEHVYIMDPASGYDVYTIDEFWNVSEGYCLILSPTEAFYVTKKQYHEIDRSVVKSFFVDVMHNNVSLFVSSILVSFLVVLLGIVFSYSYQAVIDYIVADSKPEMIWVFLVGFGTISVLKIVFTMLRQHITLKLNLHVNTPVIEKYYRHILKLPLSFFDNTELGDIIIRCQDAFSIKDIIIEAITSLLLNIPMIIISFIVLSSISMQMFCVVLASASFVAVLTVALKETYRRYENKEKMQSSVFQNLLIDALKNIFTVKAFCKEGLYTDKLMSTFSEYIHTGYKKDRLMNFQSMLQSLFVNAGNVLLLGMSAYLIVNTTITTGTMMTFFSVSSLFFESVIMIISLVVRYESFSVSIKRLSELYSETEENYNESTPLSDKRNEDRDSFIPSIEVNNVSFGYGFQTKIIDDVSISIKPGKKIAFVGVSGSGKTTFAKLISGFYKPSEGSIWINNTNVDTVEAHKLRRHLSIVSQRPEVFTDSVQYNLSFDSTDENTLEKLKKAIYDLSSDSMANYENACDLSQGEQQKLSIIRALSQDGDIFILDEATSNLDCFTEKQVVDLFLNKMTDKTVIFITHKLSLIKNCDQIFLFDKGRVVEKGSHSELMNCDGLYRKMWEVENSEKNDV